MTKEKEAEAEEEKGNVLCSWKKNQAGSEE